MTKKLYFLMTVVVSVVCLCGFTACGDDDDEPKSSNSTCTCTIKYASGNTVTTTVDPSVYGFNNCSQVRHELASVNTGASVSCK